MKHIIEYSQIEFFKTHRYLELEGLIPEKKMQELVSAIESFRSKVEKKHFDKSQAFLQFHDLYREIEPLKKFLTSKTLATIISELTSESYFRLAFDQLLLYPMAKNYPHHLKVADDLSFQGLILGMMIKIGGATEDEISYLPKKTSNVVFFDPTLTLNLDAFDSPTGTEVLLVGFGFQDIRYRHKDSDPHTHLLKNYGYVFGDSLINAHHPIVFSK